MVEGERDEAEGKKWMTDSQDMSLNEDFIFGIVRRCVSTIRLQNTFYGISIICSFSHHI